MNAIDIVILAVIVLAVILALRRIRIMRKNGCSCCAEGGCTGSCAACGKTCAHKRKP